MQLIRFFVIFHFLVFSSFSGSNKLQLVFYISKDNIYIGAKAGFLPRIKIKFDKKGSLCKSKIVDKKKGDLCILLNERMNKIYNKFKDTASDIDTLNILVLDELFNDSVQDELVGISKKAGFKVVNIKKMDNNTLKLLEENLNITN